MLTITQQRTLTQEEDESLNKLANQITMIVLNVEKENQLPTNKPMVSRTTHRNSNRNLMEVNPNPT